MSRVVVSAATIQVDVLRTVQHLHKRLDSNCFAGYSRQLPKIACSNSRRFSLATRDASLWWLLKDARIVWNGRMDSVLAE